MTENYEFKAEIKKLLDILSKSLYQNKDIFLREMISNSSDALKKLKFLALKRTELLGDQELKIEIHLDSESNTLSIKDNGIGISHNQIQQLFDPFYTEWEGKVKPHIGLSLAIAQTIIHNHKGHIAVKSREKKNPGTTFILDFPMI